MLNLNRIPVNYNQEPFYLVKIKETKTQKTTKLYGPYPAGSVNLGDFRGDGIKYTTADLDIPLINGSVELIRMKNSTAYMVPASIASELNLEQVLEFVEQIELGINAKKNEKLEMVYMVRRDGYDEFPILAITQPTKKKSVKIVKNECDAPVLAIAAEKIDHYRSVHNLVLEFQETLFN